MDELSWLGPEFEYQEKDVSWYWITIIVSVLMIGAAIWQKNFLFGVFIVVAEILVLVWANREPRMLHIKVNDRGVQVEAKLYHYQDIASFSIDEGHHEDAEWTDLVLHLKHLRPTVHIKCQTGKIQEISKKLALKVRKTHYEMSMADALEKFLRF